MKKLPTWTTGIITLSITGCILILLICCGLINPNEIKDIVYEWQELIGALIGAATPLAVFFITTWYRKKNDQEEYLLLLEKNLVTAINNLIEIDTMLHTFKDNNLKRLKERVEKENALGQISVGQVFVPLSWTFTFDKDLFKQTTGSAYLENLMLQVISISQEMPILLEDISRQFDRTLTLNTQIGLMKLNTPNVHNQTLRDNLLEFENFLDLQVFGNNIPVYLRILVQAKVAIRTRIDMGIRKWKKTFSFSKPFSVETAQKMTEYFRPNINREINELKREFKSKLLLIGEDPVLIN